MFLLAVLFPLLAGIGFLIRRWAGRQHWLVGIGFFIVVYPPALFGTAVVLVELGASAAPLQAPVVPALLGTIGGALYVSGPERWLVGLSSSPDA